MYSKYFAYKYPEFFDVKLRTAAGASSSAPIFFDPSTRIDGIGVTEYEIDGGIIANNPSLYAYQLSKIFNEKANIRILSLGNGL